MEYDQEFSLALLDRNIASYEQRLANAQAANDMRAVTRALRDLDRLQKQREKMTGTPVVSYPAPSEPPDPSRTVRSRPELRDDGTVVDPHGARWMELAGYVQKLGEHFPTEYVADRCGFFSTEREFARYIRELERRIADES